jgi:hypothetical protein
MCVPGLVHACQGVQGLGEDTFDNKPRCRRPVQRTTSMLRWEGEKPASQVR